MSVSVSVKKHATLSSKENRYIIYGFRPPGTDLVLKAWSTLNHIMTVKSMFWSRMPEVMMGISRPWSRDNFR